MVLVTIQFSTRDYPRFVSAYKKFVCKYDSSTFRNYLKCCFIFDNKLKRVTVSLAAHEGFKIDREINKYAFDLFHASLEQSGYSRIYLPRLSSRITSVDVA